MLSVRAIFDGKNLSFLENIEIKQPKEVIVTFLEETNIPAAAETFAEKLDRIYESWCEETSPLSDARVFENSNFQKIIEFGKPAIPSILKRMQKQFSFIFVALEKITGENPVEMANYGKPILITKDWLAWGRTNPKLSATYSSENNFGAIWSRSDFQFEGKRE